MKADGTVTVLAARAAMDGLRARGIEAASALRAAQLSPDALASIEVRLPHQSVARLWDVAADAAHDRWFGVHVAEALPLGDYDLIDYVLCASATVGEGLARFAQYAQLIYDHATWHLAIEPHQVRLTRRVSAVAPQYDEFTMTSLLLHSQQSSGTRWTPEHVRFQHLRPDDDGTLEHVFGCPVGFGASESEMGIAPSILQLPHTRSDSRLLAVVLRYADSLLAALPSRGDLVATVSSTIARQMVKALPSLASTAAIVNLPERSLQRRLAEQGVSYSMLIDEVRRNLALKYFGDARLSIGEIAYLLHFADPAALHRAFKRWTGDTPAQYRRRLFGTPG